MEKYCSDTDSFEDGMSSRSKILKHVEPGSTVLEFGPAHGAMTKYMREELGCQVYIVELDKQSFSKSMEYAVDGLCGSASDLEWLQKFSEIKFDYILFADVLEHLYDPEVVLERAVELMKDDGQIVISVPNIAHNSIIINLIKNKFDYKEVGLLDNTHIRFFTYYSLLELIDNAGLVAVVEDATYLVPQLTEYREDYEYTLSKANELWKKDFSNVYQFVFTAVKKGKEVAIQKNITKSEHKFQATVFFDTGNGFNGEEIRICGLLSDSDDFSQEIKIPPSTVALRFDPVDDEICIVKDLEIISDKGYLDFNNANGHTIGDYHFFATRDPLFIIPLPPYTTYVTITAKIIVLSNPLLAGYQACVSDLVLTNHKHVSEIAYITSELTHNQHLLVHARAQYQAIQNAFWWRITKPARAATRVLKNALKRFPLTKAMFMSLTRLRYGNVATDLHPDNVSCSESLLNEDMGIIDIYSAGHTIRKIENVKKVSVVVLSYNYAEYIEERIDSILMQTYPIYELIILDDCSQDNSVEIINEILDEIDPKMIDRNNIRLIVNEKNSGSVFSQWKKAFELATGDYIWIAEADDSCSSNFLETLMPYFDDEEVIIAHCETLAMDKHNKVLMKDLRQWVDIFKCGKWDDSYVAEGTEELCSTMCINNTVANVSGAIVKKGDYSEILNVASTFTLAGDWYFYTRLLEKGKLAYHMESLNYHRTHDKAVSLTMDNEREFQEICRVQDEVISKHSISEETLQKVYKRRDAVKDRLGIGTLLSVIIPVYNTEKYLCRCLDSAIAALPENSEILIVNDGSPDNSEIIIHKYVEKHPSIIKYFKKENSGLADTKNFALERAVGSFVIFLDSDDYVDEGIYRKLLSAAIQQDALIAMCDIEAEYEDGSPSVHVSCCNAAREEPLFQALDTPLMATSCNMIVHKSIYADISFPSGMNNEDVAVTPILYWRAKRIAFVGEPLYKYVHRSGSIQSAEFGEHRFVILDTVRLCIDRLSGASDDDAEKIKGSVYVHQVLAVAINAIGKLEPSIKYNLMKKYMDKVNLYFPDLFTNKYVQEMKTQGDPAIQNTNSKILFYLENRMYRRACRAMSSNEQ